MPNGTNKPESVPKNGCSYWCGGGSCHHFAKKIMATLLAVFMVYGIFYLGTLIRNNMKKYEYIGRADRSERVITINGMGKAIGSNDIAVTTIGYSNTDKDVAKAQAENKRVMDKVMADVQRMGIEEKDLQSNYTIYPDYNYTQEKGQELRGYRVTNTITVKIRDLSKISEVLGLAGKYGATEVSGLSFTIDDPENLKAEAREKALADAKVKAMLLAERLGVRLGNVISYNEYDVSGSDVYPRTFYGAEGGGGGPAVVSGGTKDIIITTNITYEILPQ